MDSLLQYRTLKTEAESLGFSSFGVVSVPIELRRDYYRQWISEGQHGEMAWMARDLERRLHPENVVPEASSIIVCGQNYYQPEPERRGRIAKYALGKDYHKVVLKKLKHLCRTLQSYGAANRPYVDTGPLLEKPIAALSGIGWQGKNTMLLNRENGQWLFLGFILTTLPLPEDEPKEDRCGSCTRCIDVCPTGAITAPYQLDARKCISYLTIEHPGPIPESYRPLVGNHLFGCDDCLDVCPWNKWAQKTREGKFEARDYPDLREMLAWDDDTFHEAFAGTPIRRIKRPRWLRNVAVVLGNIGTEDDLPALRKSAEDPDPLIAEHAQWAVKQIESRSTISDA